MKRLLRWMARRSPTARLIAGSAVTAASFYAATFLVTFLQEATQVTGLMGVMLHATVFIVLLTALVAIFKHVQLVLAAEAAEIEHRRSTLSHAHQVCDRVLARQLLRIGRARGSPDAFTAYLCNALDDVRAIVEAAYDLFESTYGKSSDPFERVDFEVTFMTRSIKDQKITIPAAWNKDGRLPRSMLLRNENPDIYAATVTASVYAMASPRPMIIPDTNDPAYAELYPDQKKRIQSSIIFPVLTDTNELIGTLVVHCDKRHFFRADLERFWSDLLEIFAKRIALSIAWCLLLRQMAEKGATVNLSSLDTAPY